MPSIEELRRQLMTGELYDPPPKPIAEDELWAFLAENPHIDKAELQKRLGMTFSQLVDAFGKSVGDFGQAMKNVVDPVADFGRSVGEIAKQTEIQMERVKEAFEVERVHTSTGEVASKAGRLVEHLREKQHLEHRARDDRLPEVDEECEHCGAEPCFTFPSMTAYDWDGEGEDPNAPKNMCAVCGYSYMDEMQERWDEYNQGRL